MKNLQARDARPFTRLRGLGELGSECAQRTPMPSRIDRSAHRGPIGRAPLPLDGLLVLFRLDPVSSNKRCTLVASVTGQIAEMFLSVIDE